MGEKKKFYPKEMEQKASLVHWLHYFFHYAFDKKRSVYWEWNDFLLVVRRQRRKKTILVLEVPRREAPFLVQKHVDVSHLSPDILIGTLLFLAKHFPSSPFLPRNREYSVRFLSFLSFIHMIHKPPTISTLSQKEPDVDVPLTLVMLNFLSRFDIHGKQRIPIPSFSLSELQHEQQK